LLEKASAGRASLAWANLHFRKYLIYGQGTEWTLAAPLRAKKSILGSEAPNP
jgi:hypothetical protein